MRNVGRWSLVVWAAPVTGAAAAIWASIAPLVEGVQAHGAVARPARSSPVRYAADSFSQATISRDLFGPAVVRRRWPTIQLVAIKQWWRRCLRSRG
jgi:hypothetical protein